MAAFKVTSRYELLERFADTTVTLSTANTFSYEKLEIPFAEYLDRMLEPRTLRDRGDTSWYLFGNNNCM